MGWGMASGQCSIHYIPVFGSCIEFCMRYNDWRLSLFVIVILLIGLAIGGFIGLKMHNAVIRNAEEIISQIEEGEE